MEDVLILDEMLDFGQKLSRGAIFDDYSKLRNPDAEAICDLAMYNYIEVKSRTSI